LTSTLHNQSGNDEKGLNQDRLEQLELAASISSTQLILVFRRNISGITQRLGEIAFRQDNDEAIELYEWAAAAADTTTDLARAMRDLNTKYQAQADTIKKLNEQLEDLIQAKKQHETLLLEKFQALLNAKKLKIRDQQRLLAGAKVDPQKGKEPLKCLLCRTQSRTAAQVQQARQTQSTRPPRSSRSTKRTAEGKSPHATDTDSEDTAFEKEPAMEAKSDAEKETPPHSDLNATDDEDDDDLNSVPLPDTATSKGRVMESQPNRGSSSQKGSPTPPPPPRQLRFATDKKVATAKSQSPPIAPTDGQTDDSETSDDEL